MFSKVKGRDGRNTDAKGGPPSIISVHMRMSGDVVSSGEIQVDGSVEGDIKCKTLIIGTTGSIKGQVEAVTARIHGAMTGTLQAKSIFLAATAKVVGDITHESLAIEPGAVFDGHCRHLKTITETIPDIAAIDAGVGPGRLLTRVAPSGEATATAPDATGEADGGKDSLAAVTS